MHLLLDGKEVCYSDNRNLYRDITCPSSSLGSYAIANNHECVIHRDIGYFSVENYFFLYREELLYEDLSLFFCIKWEYPSRDKNYRKEPYGNSGVKKYNSWNENFTKELNRVNRHMK